MRKGRMNAGGSRVRVVKILLIACCVACLPVCTRLAAAGEDKPKKGQEPYALIAGTVFRDTGFSLPGADVTVIPAPEAGSRAKVKKIKAISDARGEFAVRVPAVPMRYTVGVKASGYRAQDKSISITADERVELFFRLEPE